MILMGILVLILLFWSVYLQRKKVDNAWDVEKLVHIFGRQNYMKMVQQNLLQSDCRLGDKTSYLDQYMVNLTGPKISHNDPKLLKVLRSHVIDPPSPWIPKMSYPLFKTPQAEAVDKILSNKVRYAILFWPYRFRSNLPPPSPQWWQSDINKRIYLHIYELEIYPFSVSMTLLMDICSLFMWKQRLFKTLNKYPFFMGKQ